METKVLIEHVGLKRPLNSQIKLDESGVQGRNRAGNMNLTVINI